MLTNQVKLQSNIDFYWKMAIFSFFAVSFIILPGMAAAGSSPTNFCTALQNILSLIQGTPAKVIATLAIIFIGISAFFGKLNWGTALLVGVGIAAIFGASTIMSYVSTGSGTGATAGGAC